MNVKSNKKIYNSRTEAYNNDGLYYKGNKVCEKHNSNIRYVHNTQCVECLKEYNKEKAAEKKEKGRERKEATAQLTPILTHNIKREPQQPKEKKKNYLTNKNLLAELEKCHEQDKMTEEFGKMMMLLANRYASKPNFASYTYREDMVSHAVLSAVIGWRNFDAEKSQNPFAYFTQIMKNAFIQVLNKEGANSALIDVITIDLGLTPRWSVQIDHEMEQRIAKETKRRKLNSVKNAKSRRKK